MLWLCCLARTEWYMASQLERNRLWIHLSLGVLLARHIGSRLSLSWESVFFLRWIHNSALWTKLGKGPLLWVCPRVTQVRPGLDPSLCNNTELTHSQTISEGHSVKGSSSTELALFYISIRKASSYGVNKAEKKRQKNEFCVFLKT